LTVDVYSPAGEPRGVVALIHGGFWQASYGREGLADCCHDLASRGFVAGNVGYRRVGERGGGFPNTCTDVVDALTELQRYGELRAIVGHSAGGQLALWAAKEVRAAVVVSVAGVNALRRATELGYGDRAINSFAGDRVDEADPVSRVPVGVPTVLISPTADYEPGRDLTRTYAAAARAVGDDVAIVEPVGDHFDVINTGSEVWAAVLDAISAA
jgi:acetyl esterase/lipase